MISKIIIAEVLAINFLVGIFVGSISFACNRRASCVMDCLCEDYKMKQDGRMNQAILAGGENMVAFRTLQRTQQLSPAKR